MASALFRIKALLLLLISCTRAAVVKHFLEPHRQGSEAATVPPSKSPLRQACAVLENKDTFHAVDVEVGSPGQRFTIVADTGSNTMIVPSCICQHDGFCSTEDRCFTGTNKSSTFKVVKTADRQPAMISITFGSGTISGVVATDKVKVGGLETYMKTGLMLMTQKVLDFGGPFEGILGLGIPPPEQAPRNPSKGARRAADSSAAAPQDTQDMQDVIDWLKDAMKRAAPSLLAPHEEDLKMPPHGDRPAPGLGVMPGGFLEQAGIKSFGICFNEGSNGVLRLGLPADDGVVMHASVGAQHWGLGMEGISLVGGGGRPVDVRLCSKQGMKKGQETPCGAIIDSGTTLITGPADGLGTLLDALCDEWPRCRRNHTALIRAVEKAKEAAVAEYGTNPFEISGFPKHEVLKFLLSDCESWLNESSGGLAELPAVQFHVTGANGTSQSLELPPSMYVMETSLDLPDSLNVSSGKGHGMTKAEKQLRDAWFKKTQGRTKVCQPAFSAMEYPTLKNGPVWILGSPFFYRFNVGYDLGTTPPSLSLTPVEDSPCGSCDRKVGLVGEKAVLLRDSDGGSALRRPLRMDGVPRGPSFDLGRPL